MLQRLPWKSYLFDTIYDMSNRPHVGLGIIIENGAGEILVAKRAGSHARKYSIPGGGLELGETFEAGAVREVEEEHGITIIDPEVIAVTNNLETYWETYRETQGRRGIHVASVILVAKSFEGVPRIMEPDKCEEILWANPQQLPQPHFEASRLGVECYLSGDVYRGIAE